MKCWWRPRRRTPGQEGRAEETSPLFEPGGLGPRSGPDPEDRRVRPYDATERPGGGPAAGGERAARSATTRAAASAPLAAFLCLAVALAAVSLGGAGRRLAGGPSSGGVGAPPRESEKGERPPVPSLSESSVLSDLVGPILVYASDVIPGYRADVSGGGDSVTYADLARSLVPEWWAATLSQLPTFAPAVRTDGVFRARKIMLKTRDLLDAFGPAYPNDTGPGGTDLWTLTRRQLMRGYEVVGEFQDLHNCRVMHTAEREQELRDRVLEWREEFEEFIRTHDVEAFLSAPSKEGPFEHRKTSHLFWLYVESSGRPEGSDPAGRALCVLGTAQLDNVLTYLRLSRPYGSVLDEHVHSTFHNLRKELRSLVDEFELLGFVAFPAQEGGRDETEDAVAVLERAKEMLGDINDDWVAHDAYVANNVYPDEQVRLKRKIREDWAAFKRWTVDVEFEGAARFLQRGMNSTYMRYARGIAAPMSLGEFLRERRERPTSHFVVGNEAGDADSIISAIALAYIESAAGATQKTPLVSIPRSDLESRRPEVSLLLTLAGLEGAMTDDLIFVDDPLIDNDAIGADATLVDHNVLQPMLGDRGWTVREIVDHHQDEGLYANTCPPGPYRTVAFEDGKAAVASACTLVAERLRATWNPPPYPASPSALLLGVILLDSVNLSPEAGRATRRDLDAVTDLLENADWADLPEQSRRVLGIDPTLGGRPDTATFFGALQDAKYDPTFWGPLPVRDCLRYDYKQYPYEGGGLFGVSTILMPLEGFFGRSDLADGILEYMAKVGLRDFLGIMFAYEDSGGHLNRQLALCGTVPFPLDDAAEFMQRPHYFGLGRGEVLDLELKEIDGEGISAPHFPPNHGDLSCRLFVQGNDKLSRKQIAPLLQQFLQSLGGSRGAEQRG